MSSKSRFIVAIIGILVLTGVGLWGWSQFQSMNTGPEDMDTIVVAYSPFESCALFLIAVDQHFFEENGLNLTLYKSDSGAAALDDMLNGKADLAVSVSEFPLVRKVFRGTPARAVASIDRADYIYIVARKDLGIEDPPDLSGKRIGTASGSIAEFYLGRFLTLHGLGIGDVQYVSGLTPPETSDALVNGDLDAAVLAQPYADLAKERLGANAVVWPAQSSQPLYALVVSTEGWIAEHPEQLTRFLRALAEAEEYTIAHPAEAKAILQRRLGLDPGYMDTAWEQNQFTLSLDQSFITAMEDEARWMIANNMTDAESIPDFTRYVSTESLEQVKPGSVYFIAGRGRP